MKLHNRANSPYAARVRIQINHKSLPVALCEPADSYRTPAFRDVFPLGKVPLLELADGRMLAESTVIMEYLEDMFPEFPMRPQDPFVRAEDSLLSRWADTHLGPALFPLFELMLSRQLTGDTVPGKIDALATELDKFDALLRQINQNPEMLTLGKACVMPSLFYALEVPRVFGHADVLAELPGVRQWWDQVLAFAAVSTVLGELEVGYHELLNMVGVAGNA